MLRNARRRAAALESRARRTAIGNGGGRAWRRDDCARSIERPKMSTLNRETVSQLLRELSSSPVRSVNVAPLLTVPGADEWRALSRSPAFPIFLFHLYLSVGEPNSFDRFFISCKSRRGDPPPWSRINHVELIASCFIDRSGLPVSSRTGCVTAPSAHELCAAGEGYGTQQFMYTHAPKLEPPVASYVSRAGAQGALLRGIFIYSAPIDRHRSRSRR